MRDAQVLLLIGSWFWGVSLLTSGLESVLAIIVGVVFVVSSVRVWDD